MEIMNCKRETINCCIVCTSATVIQVSAAHSGSSQVGARVAAVQDKYKPFIIL